ncbi:MAG: HAD family hydrolase [Cytophagales bacterium]|nr:MAG: HAD family hydrolase [Cytophagales bacterium]
MQAFPKLIAFDADDTLWANQPLFDDAEEELRGLLKQFGSDEQINQVLIDVQTENLRLMGYGAKGFMLSMIEVAIRLTDGAVRGTQIQQIIDLGKELLRFPIKLIDGVEEVLQTLSADHELMVLTKGDLLDQESKLARSGVGQYFSHVEIVSEKHEAAYRRILARYHVEPADFLMIGNSLKSDILPVMNIGGQAIHIPYHTTWHFEQLPDTNLPDGHVQVESIRDVLGLLQTLGK